VKYEFTNPLTDYSSSDSQTLLIQSQPEIRILNDKPYQQCEGIQFALNAEKEWAKDILWTTNGNGTFNGTSANLSSTYDAGTDDTLRTGLNGRVMLRVSTRPEGVCPIVYDTIPLIIEAYPQFDFVADDSIQCEAATVNFEALLVKPAPGSPNLRYTWDFGNMQSIQSGTDPSPSNIVYDTAKRDWYTVTLIVENKWGTNDDQVCAVRLDKPAYIKVLPQPVAQFSSDPANFTTVAFPKFKFANETKVRWESPGAMDYLWHFGENDEDDTSTEKHPVKSYPADTMSYWVHLTSTYRYIDIHNNEHVCWDTTGQPRKIGPDVTVFVPTAFSPERTGPSANNVFLPIVNGEKTYHVELYNRWGEKLWESDDKFESWDGTYEGEDVQQDVYAWLIIVTAYDGEEYKYEGTVTLLR